MLVLALLLQVGPDTALVAASLRARTAGDSVLTAGYGARDWSPIWFSAGRPTTRGIDLHAALVRAEERGLDPAHYPSASLTVDQVRLAERHADWLAALEIGLTRDALGLARALAVGRVAPTAIMRSARIEPGQRFDSAATLDRLVASADPATLFDSLEPGAAGYRLLRSALPALRAWAGRVPPLPSGLLPAVLRPGDPFSAADRLAGHLRLLGDSALPDSSPGFAGHYEGALVEAIRRYQERHGLAVDGVIGPATRAALAIPPVWRVRQVELALERWRWFGDAEPGPVVDVDVAAAVLRHRDPTLAEPELASRVIVGNSDWQTPDLLSTIVRVVINPEWIVPTSIARGELLPQFRADSTLFARDGYELRRSGAVVPATPANLAAVGQGVVLRQRPGPRNALGRIKLEIAGTSAVHLHDTPGRQLFGNTDRWLSHGCVRVQRIEELARRLLAGDDRWPAVRLDAALADTMTVAVVLRQAVPVRLRYATAAVDSGGRLVFRPDRYDRDRRLDEALRR